MLPKKKKHPAIKTALHPRNKHRQRYNFELLTQNCPELAPFVHLNDYGDLSIDFFDPVAVKMLNSALLKQYYGIVHWDIPEGYLCPPIPGRADYLHHMADLLYRDQPTLLTKKRSDQPKIQCLDIGVGANCIYPIIGSQEYGWSFIGSEIDSKALETANKIVGSNPSLKGLVTLRLQPYANKFFTGILLEDEKVDLTICNPPFHASLAEAQKGSLRKLKNISQNKRTKLRLNFGGKGNELWCNGGEERFIRDMIYESRRHASSCFWFSTLISRQSNLEKALGILKKIHAVEVKTLPMGQGNKISRVLAWTFLTKEAQDHWMDTRWT